MLLLSRYGLAFHKKCVHKKQFKFRCKVCNKGYNHRPAFNGHIRSHNQLKIPCDQCDSSFTYMTSLKSHQKAAHGDGNVSLQCDAEGCSLKFTTYHGLHDHKRAKHSGQTIDCKICGKSYNWRSSFKYHMNTVHKT